ncbi:hypothetical protein AERO_10050 [Aeromicrobium fastidiosum]|uniref:hypothetical protein n=1 Tax=Aeromicrobium fastidiosum TaxID=52699 RepID=UPI00202334B6|nr:hypothetical protein [Aeromicrobium fastidiosum]MCL8251725.1 hypothetical protein [Aeromicrobium fastidiosum]
MTTLISDRPGPSRRPSRPVHRWELPQWSVPAAATVAVLARVPFIGHAPGPDEAGFLLVGGQWDGPGSSLYGSYFVDRPPLLVTIFRAAALLGGIPALRVIGCIAVVVVVVGCGRVATLVAGRYAGRWSSLAAAALCTSPLLGRYAVNGELLAAPFVVLGMLAIVRGLRADSRELAVAWMTSAGALAVCAVLVKQNFVDVAVFAGVLLVVSAARSELSARRSAGLAAAGLAGAAAATAVAAVWTVSHGTSLHSVYEAMYPFRVRAGQVIATESQGHAYGRLPGLVGAAIASGLAVLVMLAAVDLARRRRRSTVEWALVAAVVLASASVALGGNFWHHYLVGLVVPVSVLSGVLAARAQPPRAAIGYVVGAAALSWVAVLGLPQGSDGQTIGTAVAAAAEPHDTIINLYGHADVVQTSGLTSPYAQLWSLPTKTLDPDLTELDRVLTGPQAPTWVVTGRSVATWGLRTADTVKIIGHDYRHVATVCHRRIYLRDGISRPAPHPRTTCRGQLLGSTIEEKS